MTIRHLTKILFFLTLDLNPKKGTDARVDVELLGPSRPLARYPRGMSLQVAYAVFDEE